MFRTLILLVFFVTTSLCAKTFYDANDVRYTLCQSNGGKAVNWLFLPGGPGADSSYLKSLIAELNLPGNVWLIDMPGNGNNDVKKPYDYNSWIAIFPQVVTQFENPVLVGHSFGGMFPLLFPEMEKCLAGFVILNSAPSFWLEEAAKYGKQFNLPDLTKQMQEFRSNPTAETFKAALAACVPYYFPKHTLEKGRELLINVAFPFEAAVWWQRYVLETNFTAKWIPKKVPTMIIGGKYDCVTPFSLFANDKRFKRKNIELCYLQDEGHFPWVENPKAVSDLFTKFIRRLP